MMLPIVEQILKELGSDKFDHMKRTEELVAEEEIIEEIVAGQEKTDVMIDKTAIDNQAFEMERDPEKGGVTEILGDVVVAEKEEEEKNIEFEQEFERTFGHLRLTPKQVK